MQAVNEGSEEKERGGETEGKVVETEGDSLPGGVQRGGEKGPTGSCRVSGGLGNHSWNA